MAIPAGRCGSHSLLRRWFCTATATEMPVSHDMSAQKSLFNKLLRVSFSADSSKPNTIAEAVNEWVSEGNSIKRWHIISLINYFRSRKDYDSALQLSKWMEDGNIKMNNGDRAIQIDLLTKSQGLACAENYFNSLQHSAKTSKTYGALLSCYCKEKKPDKALEIFEKMEKLNYTSTLNYNNVLSLYLSIDEPGKVPSLVKEMEEKGIAADIYTYNILMKAYASLQDLDAIERVVEKMKANGIKFDWLTYGHLVSIYIDHGSIDKANAVLQKMETMKDLRDREAFHTLITLYSRMNDLSGVKRAWKSLKSTLPVHSNMSYLCMLLALSKLGDLEGLVECFKEWGAGCSNYDFRVPNVIMEFYLNRDMIEEANSLYESLVKREAEPNLRMLNSFANLCVRNGQIDLALDYLETGADKAVSKNLDWFPMDETLKSFLRYFKEESDSVRAEKFMKIMRKLGRLDSTMYDSLRCSDITASRREES